MSAVSVRAVPASVDPPAGADVPDYPTVVESIVAAAAASPDAAAIQQGDRITSYAALLAGAAVVRRALLGARLEPGAVVAVGGRGRSPGLIAAMIGTLAARSVMLMIDTEFPDERSASMARRAGVRHVVWVGRRGLPSWARAMPHTIAAVECAAPADARAGSRDEAAWRDGPARRDPAYIFFTSGSTGAPKGVLGAHHGLAHFITWQRETFGASASDRCAALTRVSFDVMLRDVFLPLTSGACLLLPEEADERADRVLGWLESTGATWAHLVPSLTRVWIESAPGKCTLPRLRATFFAGEPLTDVLVRRWRAIAPASEIMNLYGPTETTLATCCAVIGEEPEPGVQPVGVPLPHAEIVVLADGGRPAAPGSLGEIGIRTPFRTLGYVDGTASAADVARFRTERVAGGVDTVVYMSGDLGRVRRDGQLEVRGRVDDQLKVNGVRIEPGEIERTIIQVCEVRDAVVALVAGPGDQRRLAAYVVAGDRALAPGEIRAALAPLLPRAMIPSMYVFVPAIPLNANGKRDRRALPPIAWDAEPAARDSRARADTPGGAPDEAPELEARVAAVWRAALARTDVAPTDDVFTLGATSVVALSVAARLSIEFGRDVPVGAILARPTPRGQAAWIREVDEYLSRHAECAGVRYGPDRAGLAFGFPPLLGYGLAFSGLASHLTRHALHCFDLPDSGDPVLRLANAVRAIDARGPYTFVGYSAGGNLAFDVAVALERAGSRVDRIVMLDAQRRDRPEALSEAAIDEIVWGNIENLAGLMRETPQFRDFVRNEFLIERMSLKMRAFLRYESTTANSGRTRADIDFVHSDDREPCLDWRDSTTGAFTVQRGRGSHLEMTLEPNAEFNGRLVDQILHTSR